MKETRRLSVILVLLALLFLPITALGSEEWQTRPIPSEVESGVICVLDGCMMNLAACQTSAGEKLRGIIREKMFKEGLNKDQTYAYLVAVYGDKVLAAPPKKGFNWVVWLGPFVATIGGGAFIYLGLEKWVGVSLRDEEEEADPLEPDAARRLDEELKKYL